MSDPPPTTPLERPVTVNELAEISLSLLANVGALRSAIQDIQSGQHTRAAEHIASAISHQHDAISFLRKIAKLEEPNALLR